MTPPALPCSQQAIACRGAMDRFIGTMIEYHVRQRLADPMPPTRRTRAAEDSSRWSTPPDLKHRHGSFF